MSWRRPRAEMAIAAVLLCSPLLSGCSGDGEELDLAGRTFTSTGVKGHSLVEGTNVRLSFEDERVSAQAGCNTLIGGASWTDGVLTTGPLGMTMMACDDALSKQDEWLSEFLASKPAIRQAGDTLVIGDDSEGITLKEEGS